MRSSFSASRISQTPNPVPDEDFAAQFNELLDALGIKDARRNQMLSLPDTSKQMLLKEHQQKSDNFKNEIHQYLLNLKSLRPNPDDVQHLRVQLCTAPLSYINEFLDKNGFCILIDIITQIIPRTRVVSASPAAPGLKKGNILLLECTRCLRALLNTKKGLDVLLAQGHCINAMCLLLSTGSQEVASKILILEVLAALCILTKDGYKLAFLGMKNFQKTMKEEKPFECLMQILMSEKDFGGNVDLLIACMSFINSIVNSPEDLPSRLRNRKTFINQGILTITKELQQKDPDLKVQVNVFIEEMNADAEELTVHQAFLENIDQEDVLSVFRGLEEQARKTDMFVYFLLFFKQLLQLTADPSIGTGIWNQLYMIENQMTRLYGAGYDGVESLLVSTDSISQVDQMEIQLRALKKANDENKYEISKLRQESEHKNKMITELMQQAKAARITSSILPSGGSPLGLSSSGSSIRTQPVRKHSMSSFSSSISPSLSIPGGPKGLTSSIGSPSLSSSAPDLATTLGDSEVERLRKQVLQLTEENAQLRKSPLSSPVNEVSSTLIPSTIGSNLLAINGSNGSNKESATTEAPPPPPPPSPPPPPPPPPPGGKGAPPPPPMPLSKGVAKAPKAAPKGRPQIDGPKPSGKMRAFNWTKVPDSKIDDTLWESLYPNLANSASLLNYSEIETYFLIPIKPPPSAKKATPKKTQEPPKSVLDTRRANNLCIFLSTLKRPTAEELVQGLNTLDEEVLNEELLERLQDYLPTPEEEAALRGYKGDRSTLSEADRFLWKLIQIPKLSQRLRVLKYTSSFDQLVAEIGPDIVSVQKGSLELRTSLKWKRILQLILAVGNFLNADSTRGGAYGFKLETLTRLIDAKSTKDSKVSLLTLLVKSIKEALPDLVSFHEELLHVDPATKVSLNHLASLLATLKNGLGTSTSFLNEYSADSADSFRSVLELFLDRAKVRVNKLVTEHELMLAEFRQAAKVFGEDEKVSCEELFGPVSLFIKAFKAVSKEVDKKIEQEAQLGSKLETQTTKLDPSKKEGGAVIADKGAMDNTLTALKNGNHFRHRRNQVTH